VAAGTGEILEGAFQDGNVMPLNRHAFVAGITVTQMILFRKSEGPSFKVYLEGLEDLTLKFSNAQRLFD